MAGFLGLCHHERVTTVLIVDDHPSFRSSAHALLEAEGYEIVGEAEDGESAIEAAERLHPDIVLLDVQLPDIDGFEVARRLTSDGNGPERRPRVEPRADRLRLARRRQWRTRLPPEERAHGGRGCSAHEVKLTRDRLWLGMIPAIIGLATLAAVLTARSNHEGNPAMQAVVLTVIGVIFGVSGVIARMVRPDNGTGLLLLLVSLLWFINAFLEANSRWVLGLASIFGSLFLAAFVHLMLAYPEGKLGSRLERRMIAGLWITAFLAGALPAIFNREFDDCKGCPDNPFLVADHPQTANALQAIFTVVGFVIFVGVIVLLVRRWRRATPAQRRELGPVYLSGGVATALVTALFLVSSVVPLGRERPGRRRLRRLRRRPAVLPRRTAPVEALPAGAAPSARGAGRADARGGPGRAALCAPRPHAPVPHLARRDERLRRCARQPRGARAGHAAPGDHPHRHRCRPPAGRARARRGAQAQTGTPRRGRLHRSARDPEGPRGPGAPAERGAQPRPARRDPRPDVPARARRHLSRGPGRPVPADRARASS